ncbi:hypothetical protein [Elongatibacter sediminis]|uniref:Uncharacterized protein n=1 Tax=Elongatibacter sediminis TaxID=3119006 RepID=A0AAW9RK94_9GAMM
MNVAVPETAGSAAGSDKYQPTIQASKVLPELWRRLPEGERITVLDLGRAQPETIDSFAGLSVRIQVLDLYDELASGRFDKLPDGSTWERQFQELFHFAPGTRIDLCLLWDLPHYLDEKRLRAFSRALWPWLTPASLAHGFGVRSAGTSLLNREYGIRERNAISVRARRMPQLPCKPHPPAFMNEWLTCFSTGRGVLLPDGKVETLMVARVGS